MIADSQTRSESLAVVHGLQAATNAHDLDALADCFTDDYLGEIPLHPSRFFRGRDQVRRNWEQILAAVPDLRSQIIREVGDGNVAWTEWEWTGRRLDGAPHLMRGTTIVGVEGERIAWARFYMEPVVDDGVGINAAMAQAVATGAER
jgi:ketosteroid isomerase-like protein